MNPSIDLFGVTERLIEDAKSRCRDPRREPGGGGINVARTLHRLGAEVFAIFPGGGFNGDLLEQLLVRDRLPCQRIPIARESRQSLAITEETRSRLFHFVFPGAALDKTEWQACYEAVSRHEPAPDYLILSGSLPEGVPADFYGRLAQAAQRQGTKVVLDTSGPALHHLAGTGTYLIKLNRTEFAQLGSQGSVDEPSPAQGQTESQVEKQLEAMQRMLLEDDLCEILIVTLGANGALLASRDGAKLHFAPPPTSIVSHVGAGDAFVAVLVYQLQQGNSVTEAFRYGVAAAAAKVQSPGNQIADLDRVAQIYQHTG